MPNYRNTLKVNFNTIQNPTLEVLSEIPSAESIIDGLSPEAANMRDGWIFMVRNQNSLRPYYFDRQAMLVLPFGGTILTPGIPTVMAIGDGNNREFLIQHNRNSYGIVAQVFQNVPDRKYRVECDVFISSLNEIGLEFSLPPDEEQFLAIIGVLS